MAKERDGMKTRKKIVAIFTCFNRKDKTRSCLNHLVEGNHSIEFSFVAIDDNSTDGTKELLSEYSNVHLLNGSGNLYYSGAMHLGMEYVKKNYFDECDFVMLLNDDVDFFDHSIERLLNLSEDKDKILVGPTCDLGGRLTYGGVKKKSLYMPSFSIVLSDCGWERCDTFNANCVLIPYDIFIKEPIMDERYVHALGDFDYGLMLSKNGYDIIVSNFYVGICNDNPIEGTWRDKWLPIKKRIELKETPKGLPLRTWFYFVNKHYGLLSACISSIKPYIRIILKK